MTDWVPVVDVSRHQGAINFHVMRSKGVRGLILRISHGLVLDSKAEEYYGDAVAAGFAPADIGWYPFINPKRSSAADAAEFAVEHILRIGGQPDFLYMLDVENYKQESPDIGNAPVFGPQFAAHIREHIATVKALSPKSRVIGYTNRAYWNGKIYKGSVIEWVGDDTLAGELDWIVARYPVYSHAGYAAKPLPPDTRGWDEWAFKAAPDGPFPPRGASGWESWQFSAGYNQQGQAYGASSSDLDLNIVHPEAWARWTATPLGPPTEEPVPFPPPTPGPPQSEDDDMPQVISNDETAAFEGSSYPRGVIKWVIDRPNAGDEVASKRHLGGAEHAAYGSPAGRFLNNAQLNDLPDYLPDVEGGEDGVDLEARAAFERQDALIVKLNDSLGRLGQRQSSAGAELREAASALLGD